MRLRTIPVAAGAAVAVLGLGAAGIASAQEDDGSSDVTVTTEEPAASTDDSTVTTDEDGTVTDDSTTTEDGAAGREGCDDGEGRGPGRGPGGPGGEAPSEAPATEGETLSP